MDRGTKVGAHRGVPQHNRTKSVPQDAPTMISHEPQRKGEKRASCGTPKRRGEKRDPAILINDVKMAQATFKIAEVELHSGFHPGHAGTGPGITVHAIEGLRIEPTRKYRR